MEFLLKFNTNQVNLVIKGLESLRDSSNDTVQSILQQIKAQSNPVVVNQVPITEPAAAE